MTHITIKSVDMSHSAVICYLIYLYVFLVTKKF